MVAAIGLAAGLLAACGTTATSPTSSGASASKTIVTEATGSGSLFSRNFNPWSPNSSSPMTDGMIYESLLFFDPADAATVDPWLAQSYRWSDGGRSITFDLRHGVTWTNGTPFTSADVAFTFDLEMKDAALNTYDLPYKSVSTSGPYQVTVDFTSPAYSDLIYLAGDTAIVNKAIWSKVSDPATYLNPDPVGTGAYVLSAYSSEAMTFTANQHYYMANMPYVKTIRFDAYSSNVTGESAIEAGTIDWASFYTPDINASYLSRSKSFKVISVPLSTAVLEVNDATGPTSSLPVREAISDAIDRNTISQTVYGGYAPPTDPELLPSGTFASVIPSALKGKTLPYDPSESKKLLEQAGYHLGSNGMFDNSSGAELTVSAQVQSTLTDYVSVMQVLAQELKAAGINLNVQSESQSEFGANQESGKFQLMITNIGGTSQPYAFYYANLDHALTAPIGKTATGDYGRFDSTALDQDLAEVAAQPSISAQEPYFAKAEEVVASQLPYIPLFGQQDETEVNGAVLTGLPTATDRYAAPTEWLSWNNGWVSMHMKLAK